MDRGTWQATAMGSRRVRHNLVTKQQHTASIQHTYMCMYTHTHTHTLLSGIPGEKNGNSLQYSCLENPIDRETFQATVHGVTKNWTQLSN